MNTVTDLSRLCTRTVTDPDEIDRLRWFQTTRYFECGLLKELPTQLPDDPFVGDSTYFAVDAGDELHATARIVMTGRTPEILRYHSLYPAAAERVETESYHVAEVSRLAVGRNAPHYEALSLLAREFLRFGARHQQGLLLLASVGKPLVRILNRLLGVPIQIVGPQIEQYGDYIEETMPVLIDTVECLQVFRTQRSRRWEFFLEGLVIDLRDGAAVG